MHPDVLQGEGYVIWLTGLSGSGKSTLGDALAHHLMTIGLDRIYRLDGDTLRDGLNADLRFSQEDRDENLRRAAHVARLFADQGFVVIASFITPLERQRMMIRSLFSEERYREVWLSTPLAVCEQRDPKGLYQQARQGLIHDFTGIGSTFEPAVHADVVLDTQCYSPSGALSMLMSELFESMF